jgi:hypothetical protein
MSPIAGTVNVPILFFKQIGFTEDWKYIPVSVYLLLRESVCLCRPF